MERRRPADARRSLEDAMALPVALLVPGVLIAYLGYQLGGFFPAATGVAAVVLIGLVLLLLMLPARPWYSVSTPWAILVAALVLLAALQLLSAMWSDAAGRAVLESDRTLLYLAGAVVGGLVGRRPGAYRWLVLGIAGAAVAICVGGFISRALPDVLHVTLTNHPERLSYPLTYWNAMGFVAGLGIVLAAGLASDARESRLVRVLATGSLPLTASVLLLTLSRGPIAACLGALVLFAIVGRPRGLPGAALAAAVPVGVALATTYAADELTSAQPQSQLAVDQGLRVAAVVACCCLAAGGLRLLTLKLDTWFAQRPSWSERSRRAFAGAVAAAVGAVVLVLLVSGTITREYDRFVNAAPLSYADERDRLLNVGNNGRVGIWNVAWETFADAPLHGTGAGTFGMSWDRLRPNGVDANDAHSVYLETLSELGLPGALLLLAALGAVAFGFGARARAPVEARTLPAAVLAAGAMWLIHAGIDWDWEMPATTLWLFVLGGAALATVGRRPALSRLRPGTLGRILAGLACMIVAVTPVRVALSQSRLDRAVQAFLNHDCLRASELALGSLGAIPVRAEPWEVIAYCDSRAGEHRLAERAMLQARRRDPRNWELAYGLAIVRGAASHDPRPAAALAFALNPREARAQRLAVALDIGDTATWRRVARDAPLPLR